MGGAYFLRSILNFRLFFLIRKFSTVVTITTALLFLMVPLIGKIFNLKTGREIDDNLRSPLNVTAQFSAYLTTFTVFLFIKL